MAIQHESFRLDPGWPPRGARRVDERFLIPSRPSLARSNASIERNAGHSAAIPASRATVFMLRAVPSAAAGMRSFVVAMPDP